MDSPSLLPDRSHFQDPALAAYGRRLLAETVERTKADEATLWVLTQDGQSLAGALNHGAASEVVEQLSVPVMDSLIGTTLLHGEASRIGHDDLANPMSGFVGGQTGSQLHAMLACPIRIQDQVRGALTAVRTLNTADFPETALEELKWKAFLLGLLLEWWLTKRES